MSQLFRRLSRGNAFYVFLLLGLVLAVVLSLSVVGGRVEQTLATMQDQHKLLEARQVERNVSQYLVNRLQTLKDLSSLPVVTTSVMGLDSSLANFDDFFQEYRVLGEQPNVYLVDILGEVIYPFSRQDFNVPEWVQFLLDGKYKEMVTISSNQHFILAVPIVYGESVEGVLLMETPSTVTEILQALGINTLDTLIIENSFGRFEQTGDINHSMVLEEFSIANTGLFLTYFRSNSLIESERNQYLWRITVAIIFSLFIAFAVLAVFFQSMFVNPFKKLADSEKKIKKSEERYQLAVAGSNDGLWDWDIATNAVYYSPRFRQMLGYEGSDKASFPEVFDSFANALHPEDKDSVLQAAELHLKEQAPYDVTYRLQTVDRGYLYFRARGLALRDEDGTPIRMAGSLTDINEFIVLQNELKASKHAAEMANQAKSMFLANMSHEIRTPMNGILGALQIFERQDLNPEGQKLVKRALVSSKNLLAIINDILDFSKIESGKLQIEIIPVDVRELFYVVRDEMAPLAESKDVTFKLTIDDTVENAYMADPVRLKQVLINLVGNAIKFTKVGEVQLNLTTLKNGIRVTVSDTGIGMSEEVVANLFNRFEQADKSTTRKFGGTGLGLAISRQLVELMHGTIVVQSELNKGSDFIVDLPLQVTEVIPKKAPQTQQGNMDLSGFTVLLAEDNHINQAIFKAMVLPTNIELLIANDGKEAIELYQRHAPDLVFMDIQMPVMDGVESCIELKKIAPQLPVIALTANVMKEDIEKYESTGFDGHLGKPIDLNYLMETLAFYAQSAKASRTYN